METFTLGSVSLIIAVSLVIRRKNTPLYNWFAALCLALFLFEAGSFFRDIFAPRFWTAVHC